MTVRELNGWAPAQVTFAPDGSVLSVTVTEPRFSPDERALLVASRRRESEPRGAHGLLLSEVTDPANQFAFEVAPPTMDWAQKALDDAQEAYLKKYPTAKVQALLWRVLKRAS